MPIRGIVLILQQVSMIRHRNNVFNIIHGIIHVIHDVINIIHDIFYTYYIYIIKMRRFLYIIIAALMMGGAPWAINAAAQTTKPGKQDTLPSNYEQRVGLLPTRYLYGVAISYTDSVTYITNVSAVKDMAYDKTTKTPIGLDLYTESLRSYLQTQGKTGYVCSTFLCKSQKEAEKQILALRHKLQKNEVCPYQPLGGFAYQRIATEQIFTNAGEGRNYSESDDSDF